MLPDLSSFVDKMKSTKLLLLIVLTHFLLNSGTQSSSALKIYSGEQTRSGFVLAINRLLEVLMQRFPTVNILWDSNNEEVKDLIAEVLSANDESLITQIFDFSRLKSVGVRMRSIVILLEGIESFHKFYENSIPNAFAYSRFYLFVLISGNVDDRNKIFDVMWRKSVFNVDILCKVDDDVRLYTFMPFHPGSKCGDTKPVLIDKIRNGALQVTADALFPEKFKNLQGCSVQVVTFEDGIAVFKRKQLDDDHALQGFDMELLRGLSSTINFKAEIKLLETPEPWGMVYENGTATGALSELREKNAEIGLGDYFLKANRLRILDSSVPYHSFPLVFVIPPGEPVSDFKKLVQPFQKIVWILLILTFVIGLLVVLIVNLRLERVKAFLYGTGIKHPVDNMIAVIFGVSQSKLPRRNFARFLLMMFLIFCLVQRSIYQGSLFIFLQSEGLEKEVQTVEEMVEKDFEFRMYKSYADIIENQPKILNK